MAHDPTDTADGIPPRNASGSEPVRAGDIESISRRPLPISTTHFVTACEYVDKSVPYLKLTRIEASAIGEDVGGPPGGGGAWSDLAPDHVEPVALTDSPERALWDVSRQEAEKTLVDGAVTLGDGVIRARLAEIGIRRHEWECLDADTRRVIKEFLRAEADLAETVVAAAIVRDDAGARDIQKKAVRHLEQVTADLARRSKATTNPIAAIRRERAWHAAQPLLEHLTDLLTDIAASTKVHGIEADEAWVREQVARVNSLLMSLGRGRYYSCCTAEMLAKLKVRTPRQLALEITHYFHRDVTVDDLRRSEPPRQRGTPET